METIDEKLDLLKVKPLPKKPAQFDFFIEKKKDLQLPTIIDKNLICIKSILTPNEKIPLFNGATEENLEQLNQLVSDLKYKSKNKKKVTGGINVFNYKNNVVFFDTGEPPKKGFSRSYQSGPLSFEYYLDGNKIGRSISQHTKCESNIFKTCDIKSVQGIVRSCS